MQIPDRYEVIDVSLVPAGYLWDTPPAFVGAVEVIQFGRLASVGCPPGPACEGWPYARMWNSSVDSAGVRMVAPATERESNPPGQIRHEPRTLNTLPVFTYLRLIGYAG